MIWQGWGILVVVLYFGIGILMQNLINAVFHDPEYYSNNAWPIFLTAVVSGLAIWFVGLRFNGRKGQILIDKETGHEVELKSTHTFFFIPMQYWAIIIMVLTLLAYLFGSQ